MSEFNEFLRDGGMTAVLDAADVRVCPWGHLCVQNPKYEQYTGTSLDHAYVWRCSDDGHPPIEYPIQERHLLALFYPSMQGAHDTFFYIQNTGSGE